MILLFFKDRSSLQYFITGSKFMFLTFHTICNLGGGLGLWVGWEEGKEESQGSIPAYYETCLKRYPAYKPLITRRDSFPLRGLFFN